MVFIRPPACINRLMFLHKPGASINLAYRFCPPKAGGLLYMDIQFQSPVFAEKSALFTKGLLCDGYRYFGAHPLDVEKKQWQFVVWAPHAQKAAVVGEFNVWDYEANPMQPIGEGLFAAVINHLAPGECYKYAFLTPEGKWIYKADPYGQAAQLRPATASCLADASGYAWEDADYLAAHAGQHQRSAPMSIYEVHLSSWRQHEDGSLLTYREIAAQLVDYVREMGFTHVEFLPVMEYPLDDSWGYQVTGFFSVNSRYGQPEDFKYLVDQLHQAGIGVILDWVPAHFCKDDPGLRRFDGTPIYEHPNPLRGEHPEWGTCIFDYGRPQVRSFLISNAVYWMNEFHIDGLRVDAVSSMLYLDYAREAGQWLPNQYGGRENIEAIAFLRQLNDTVHAQKPSAIMIAEEATAWAMVTKPPYIGGLGFDYKWNMGWMNDTLNFMSMDSVYRKYHHDKLTFSLMYAFSENFILPLDHDEVVHGKKSLLGKMPGDYWQQFASLRLLLGYTFTHPGKKLLFMGTELAPFIEWRFYEGLEWHLLQYEMHRHMQGYVAALNHFYVEHAALWEEDFSWEGFKWLGANDSMHSIISFLRKGKDEQLAVICNFTPVAWEDYRINLPQPGTVEEIFSSDQPGWGGSGVTNTGLLHTQEVLWNDSPYSLQLRVPPLGVSILRYTPDPEPKPKRAPARKNSGAGKKAAKKNAVPAKDITNVEKDAVASKAKPAANIGKKPTAKGKKRAVSSQKKEDKTGIKADPS